MLENLKCAAELKKYEVEQVLGVAQNTLESIRDLTGRVQDVQLVYTGEKPEVAGMAGSVPQVHVGGTCGDILSVLREIDGYAARMRDILSNF